MITRFATALGTLCAGLLVLAAPVCATDLVSCTGASEFLGSTAGGPSDDLTRAAVSADGRFVAFASKAANLVPGDDNGAYDVFVRDLQAGTTRRASTGVDGVDSDGDSTQPAISADGKSVVFASSATNLVAGDTNARTDVFRKDLLTGALLRVSTTAGAAQVHRDSAEPAVSADGRYVAFTSDGTDLVGGEGDGFRDVFVKDLQTGLVVCASAPAGGGHGDYDSLAPSISADGRFVAFASSASNLIPGFTAPAGPVVYVKDLQTGAIAAASTDGVGVAGDGPADAPAISADGRFVAFASGATNLAPGCDSGLYNIYVKDRSTGAVRCASVDAAGLQGNAGSQRPSTPDGRHVVFESTATNLTAGYAFARSHVYVKDLLTGAVTRASNDSAGNQALDHSTHAAISADARVVAFVSVDRDLVAEDRNGVADVFAKDLATAAVSLASPRDPTVTTAPGGNGASSSSRFSVSGDGRFVAFWSRAANIVADDTNGVADVFVRDRAAGTTVRASTAADGTQANAMAGEYAISAGGRHVAFASSATNLVAGDANATQDVFVKDLATGAVALASCSDAGAQGNGMSSTPSISGDGRYVAFTSQASNLVGGDTNGVGDIFVKDLQSGAVVRASTGSGGEQAAGFSTNAAISADGGHVAFRSLANNLVDGDTGAADIFVKNLLTGALERVSTNGGAQADGSSDAPTLSADGRFVAFQSTAANLVAGDTGGKSDVFVKDRLTGVTQRASTSSAGAQGIADSVAPCVSDDGRYVVFESGAVNLVAGNLYALGNVFLKDLQTQEIVRMSAGRGAEEAARSSLPAISGDGRHVVFTSGAGNLVSADGNLLEDVFHAARQADLRIGASGTAQVTAGKKASFWISLRNEGPCLPEDAVVSVEVPEGTTFADAWADRPGWSVGAPPAGERGTVRFTRASVPPGITHTLTLLVNVDPGAPAGSQVTCTGHASSATEDPTPENLASWTSTVEAAVVAAVADLDVHVGAPAAVTAGNELSVGVTLANRGPDDARGVVLTAALPDGVTPGTPSQSSGPAFSFSASGREVTASIPVLPSGAVAEFVFGGSVSPGTLEGALLRSAAAVTSDTPAPVAGAGSTTAAAETRVETQADLSVTLAAPAAFTGCRGLAYRVTVANSGPSDARQVSLTHEVPAGFAVASYSQTSGPSFTLEAGAGTLTAVAAAVPAGAAATFSVGTGGNRTPADGAQLTSSAALATETAEAPSGTNRHRATATTVVAFVNDPPIADAGGPYRLLFGDDLTLDGSGSTEPDAGCGDAIASWEWDLDGDGAFGDAAGSRARLTSTQVQALLCGGACESGRSYPFGLRVTDDRGEQGIAGAQAQVILPVFSDDFSDVGPSGDPQWSVASGRWFGAEGQLVAREGTVARSLARLPAKIGAGVVEAGVLLPSTRSRGLPNGGVIFAWLGRTRYRYVRLTAQGISIVQVGTVGGQAGGTWTRARPLATDRWHALRVEVAPDGLVSVFVDGEAAAALSHRFRKAPPGRIGLGASRSRTAFDLFSLWPAAALPWPGH